MISMTNPKERFLILPYYTGEETLEGVLKNPRYLRLLWLEVLLNGEIPWKAYLDRPEVRTAYEKACVWYTHFKTMVQTHTRRPPLETRSGRIDLREYRKFLEALNFVSTQS